MTQTKAKQTLPAFKRFHSLLFIFSILFPFSGGFQPLWSQESQPPEAALAENKPVTTEVAGQPDSWKVEDLNAKDSKDGSIELLRAEEGEYLHGAESKEGVMIFRGGIVLRLNKALLYAEVIKYNPKTGELYGEGGVRYEDGLQKVTGEKFIYNNKYKAGVIYNVTAEFEPLYYIGDSLKISSSESYTLIDAFFTVCDEKDPHFSIRASKVWVQPDNQMGAVDILYYAGGVPIFYLPVLAQTELGTGILLLYGNNVTFGHFVQMSYFLDLSGPGFGRLLPESTMLMFDYYQYQGLFFGVEMQKKQKELLYDIHLSMAQHRYYDIMSGTSGEIIRSHLIQQSDGSYAAQEEWWHGVSINLKTNWKHQNSKDSSSSITLQVEDYSDYDYRQKYLNRNIPKSSLDSVLLQTFPQRMPLDNELSWSLLYEENWDDNSFSLFFKNRRQWGSVTSDKNYQYYPMEDILPQLSYQKNSQIIHPDGFLFGGAYNNLSLSSRLVNSYKEGELSNTKEEIHIRDQVLFFFPFLEYLSFTPSVGYGVQKHFSQDRFASNELENRRNSYHYFFTQNSLYLGVPVFLLSATYEYQQALLQEEVDPTFGDQISHLLLFEVSSNPADWAHLALRIGRDLRTYPNDPVAENLRWTPLIAETTLHYDFTGNTLYGSGIRKREYATLALEERFSYLTQFSSPGVNSLGLYFLTGGYKSPLFRRLTELSIGIEWIHDFLNPLGNKLLFYTGVDIEPFRYWRFGSQITSRADILNSAGDSYGKLNDFFNGGESPFLLDQVAIYIEHDLHYWVLKLSYELNMQFTTFGTNSQHRAGYYDQVFYFTMTMKDFPAVGIPETQLYQFNPENEGVF